MCRAGTVDDVDDEAPLELFSLKPFVKEGNLTSLHQSFPIRFLIDTGASGYAFIHEGFVDAISEALYIVPVQLQKPKRVRGYDGTVSKTLIKYAIYPGLCLGEYRQATMLMFITDLGDHQAILGKPWMNQCGLWLNMRNDTIVFPDGSNSDALHSSPPIPPLQLPVLPAAPPMPSNDARLAVKVLPRRKPSPGERPFTIHSVGAEPFGCLSRKPDVHIFAMSMEDLDRQLAFDRECQIEEVSLNTVEAASVNLEEVKKKLPLEHHEYLDVFDRSQANQLPPHRPSDHQIELTGDTKPPQSRAYRMPPYKLQKVKEYLNENLSKGFITPSKAPYSSPVLFALKANGDLRFCVYYRKLNAMTKRNRYPLPLIEEIIGKIIGRKHLTRLDIIAAFNKLRMHSDSEDLTTFITALGAYKYRVLPFGLTNGPSSFQQYINDTL